MRFLLFFMLLLFPACFYQQKKIYKHASAEKILLLAIHQPENILVHHNISSLLYEELFRHFSRLYQYTLVSPGTREQAFHLLCSIEDLDSLQKLISPDVVLYGNKISITIHVTLQQCDGSLCGKKTFTASTLLSNAKNPILRSSFLWFTLQTLFAKIVPKIDHWIRITCNPTQQKTV